MEVEGALVTIDAMGCQKEIAKKIVKEKGVSTAHGSNLRMIGSVSWREDPMLNFYPFLV